MSFSLLVSPFPPLPSFDRRSSSSSSSSSESWSRRRPRWFLPPPPPPPRRRSSCPGGASRLLEPLIFFTFSGREIGVCGADMFPSSPRDSAQEVSPHSRVPELCFFLGFAARWRLLFPFFLLHYAIFPLLCLLFLRAEVPRCWGRTFFCHMECRRLLQRKEEKNQILSRAITTTLVRIIKGTPWGEGGSGNKAGHAMHSLPTCMPPPKE